MRFRPALRCAVPCGVRHAFPVGVLVVVAVLGAALAAPPARAQYFAFGKNRVQYERLAWRYVQSARVDVYFYERDRTEGGGRVLADFAARAAEEALDDIGALLRVDLARRVPLLVYHSHNDFAVTNAVDLPVYAEGIGGVTELFKNRVAVPFTGDWRQFRRVIRHELVHAALNDALFGGNLQTAIRNNLQLRLPDWFDEGLAEYVAFGWDPESDLYLRDAVLAGALPDIPDLGGYYAYRGGQGVWDFVAEEYGREKVAEVLEGVRLTRSVPTAFYRATGLTLGELSDRWRAVLREAYYPEAAAREGLDALARPVASVREGGRYHASPALAPLGDRVAYVAATDALFDVYVAPTTGAGAPTKLVDGQDNAAFESLRLLTPGLSWDPAGRRLAIAAKSGRGDVLAVVDVATGRDRRYRLPSIDALLAVAWSPDSTHVALEATAGAQSDLFLLDLETGNVVNLTGDVFSDHDPAWSPDGRSLVFHSDRGGFVGPSRPTAATVAAGDFDLLAHAAGAEGGQHDLYRLDVATRALTRLTAAPSDETGAEYAGAERLVFVSDRNGVPNLYAHELATGAERPLTDLQTGVLHVSLSRDGLRAAVLALDEGEPAVHLLREPLGRDDLPPTLAPTVWAQRASGAASGAPALALAPAATRQRNPFLRDAADGVPFALVPAPDPLDRAVDSLLALGPPGPDSARGPLRTDTLVFGPPPDEPRPGGPPLSLRVPRLPVYDVPARRYRLQFSPDFVSAAGSYDTVFGVQGVTQVLFSDLLGDHRFTFASNLVLDLRNADYYLGYEALAGRADYAARGFHLARELADSTGQTVYRYRNYGVVAGARYPLDKFRRVEADLALLAVSLADLSDLGAQPRTRRFVHPRLTYTEDHTTPGWLAPGGGSRWAVSLSGSPGPSVSFLTLLADARRYGSFGPRGYGPRATFALRGSAGFSVGTEPQRFYAAGVASWLNPTYDSLPIRSPDDFVFATPVLPLRGFGFNEAAGDRFALLNAEARVPLAAALLPGPFPLLPLYNLQAVASVDAGVIAEGGLDVWRDVDDGAGGTRRVLDDVLLGGGLGLRTLLLGYPVRADWAWPFDGTRLGQPRFYLSVGLDF